MKDLTWAAVGARRMERAWLASPSSEAQPEDVAAAMCGTHAQVMAAAELSIAMRTTHLTRIDVQAALWQDHRLIKTYGLRGTVHLVAARDLAMWTAALATVPSRPGSCPEGVRLTEAESARIVEAMADALEDAELDTDELEAALVARVGAWAAERSVPAFQSFWPRWRLAVYDAVAAGVLCFGANRGTKVTWTSVGRLIPGFSPMERDAAVRALVRGYLRAYGPSTPAWFARWVAAPKRWADEAFASVGEEITTIEVEGTPASVLADDQAFDAEPSRGVRLLPYFDAYGIAWQPRDRLFPGRAVDRAQVGGQAGVMPIVLVGGVVAGVWHHRRTAKRLAITVEVFRDLSARQRADLDRQAARVGEILGAPAELTLGPVPTGGHR